ncbi:SDR family oxidoreductase [Pseudogemmatithrix spongiicola]|uniref:dTDP-4-dehydrorhamnose reductase n=1 Tax=Pseudogemmatithrix spongiicola TaxID=3062599 RepID=A0AA49JV96_9BACT|nr:SDR family oxidoreductase [Gemmatimonadaceae bacterium 'strain 138']WKW15389.1 SDR family oxidoreductase [Gemmatimonadaceae bacterium 'strain 318']
MRVLVIGATGMFGHACFEAFARDARFEAWGTMRSEGARAQFPEAARARLIAGVDAGDFGSIVRAFAKARPALVVNAVGIVKQLSSADDPLVALPLNSLFPHQLAQLCAAAGARMVHISTDCVFAGTRGGYTEADITDAKDLYGRSKAMGEVTAAPHVLTLRTSGIGRELGTQRGLVEWFLHAEGRVKGFTKAMYSGLPWVEISRVIRDVVVPRPELSGLYHLASAPISKYDLLRLVATEFRRQIEIVPDDGLVLDRTLDGSRFAAATGYHTPAWPALVAMMAQHR